MPEGVYQARGPEPMARVANAVTFMLRLRLIAGRSDILLPSS